MLKIKHEIEDWRELVTWDDSSDRDTIAEELRDAVLGELFAAGVDYERAYRQSVGAFAIVQDGSPAEREAFDAAVDKHVAALRAEATA